MCVLPLHPGVLLLNADAPRAVEQPTRSTMVPVAGECVRQFTPERTMSRLGGARGSWCTALATTVCRTQAHHPPRAYATDLACHRNAFLCQHLFPGRRLCRQLQHGCFLPFAQECQEQRLSVR